MIRHSRRPVATGGALLAVALACVTALPWSDTQAQSSGPSVDIHVVDAGGKSFSNSCFRLSGSVGEPAPGYSNSTTYSVYAGFQTTTPKTPRDEIFFNGFERC